VADIVKWVFAAVDCEFSGGAVMVAVKALVVEVAVGSAQQLNNLIVLIV
jgi:hypothetical protein